MKLTGAQILMEVLKDEQDSKVLSLALASYIPAPVAAEMDRARKKEYDQETRDANR